MLIASWTDVPWLPPGSRVQLVASDVEPPRALVTGAFGFCFEDGALLMVHHEERGWGIPGGHPEEGESLDAALRRELFEEAGARLGALRRFAHFELQVSGPRPVEPRYPHPTSYLVFFLAELVELRELPEGFETRARRLVPLDEARATPWTQDYRELLDLAVRDGRASA